MRFRHEQWPDSTGGTPQIGAPGRPTTVAGTITLRPEGSGTREIVEPDLAVEIALVGGRLEKPVAERITSGMDAEHAAGVAHHKEN